MNPELSGWLALANILISGGITVVLFRISQTVRRYDRLEDTSKKSIDSLEKTLHAANVKLIDERFRAISHEVNDAGHTLSQAMDEVKKRLADGDVEIDGLSERDHAMELKIMGRIDELKCDLRESLHQSMRTHEQNVGARIESLGSRVADVAQAVAVLGDRMTR